MKFLLGQRLFNNIFVQLELFNIQETTKKIKYNKKWIKVNKINFIQEN